MKTKYYLIYKSFNKSFAKYRGDAINISEEIPHTVDEIWIGVKKHPEKTRRITTFRDKDGNIIERSFDFADGKLRNRLYRYDYTKISDTQAVKSTEIRDMYIRKRVLPYRDAILENNKGAHLLKTLLWNITSITTNHFNWNKTTNEKVLSQTIISNMEKPTKERHTFIEFPHIIDNKIQNMKRKLLSFSVNIRTNKVQKENIVKENVRFPKYDSFLNVRALNVYEAREPLTTRFINERNLKDKNIIIEPYYYPKNEDEKLYSAHFDPDDGSINFNRFHKAYSKAKTASTAAHEAEHGWQYFLRARYKEPATLWEEDMHENFGPVKDKKLLKEAQRYYKSIIDYTPMSKALKDSGKEENYNNAYIEIKAKKRGTKAEKQYNKEGKTIRNNFKYIPERFL